MDYNPQDLLASGVIGAYAIVYLVVLIVMIIGMWKMFTKADKPGWASLVPFYNMYCLYDIGFGVGWLFLLTFIPCVNFVISVILSFKLAKAYGHGVGFGFGILFLAPIFYMILGFGQSEYIGPQ